MNSPAAEAMITEMGRAQPRGIYRGSSGLDHLNRWPLCHPGQLFADFPLGLHGSDLDYPEMTPFTVTGQDSCRKPGGKKGEVKLFRIAALMAILALAACNTVVSVGEDITGASRRGSRAG